MNEDSATAPGLSTIELSYAGTNASIGATTNSNDAYTQSQRAPNRKVSSIDAPIVKTGISGASSNLVNAIVGAFLR